jgi:hypothetical protein
MGNEMASPGTSESHAAQAEYLNKLFRWHVQGAYVRSGASLGLGYFSCPFFFFVRTRKLPCVAGTFVQFVFWELCKGAIEYLKRKRGKSEWQHLSDGFSFITSRALVKILG